MGGIVGIYNRDGRPADTRLLARMMAATAYRGPDGSGKWAQGAVALGYQRLDTTTESLTESQPVVDEVRSLCLTFDGRIDNREELRALLAGRGLPERSPSDAELVLRAYELWGEGSPARLLGDFAFVLWDGPKHRLVCVRDIFGFKSFHYFAAPDVFAWASDAAPLFEHPRVPQEPNERIIGDHLQGLLVDNEETLYRGILRLPPAHMLVVTAGGLSKTEYWSPDPHRTVRHRTDAEYGEHFHAVFKEAVRCRLRSHRPVAIEVSGGLDSSSVATMANALQREGAAPTPSFETLSMIFPGLPCDETAHIEAVLGTIDATTHIVEDKRASPDPDADVRRFLDFPDYPNSVTVRPLRALARERGCRVLLTGLGGDEWMSNNPLRQADLLQDWRLVELFRRQRQEIAACGWRATLRSFGKFGLLPLLPEGTRLWVRGKVSRYPVRNWINPAFAARIGLGPARIWGPARARGFRSHVSEECVALSTGALAMQLNELEDRTGSFFEIEERHPLFDRRLVELLLALPEDQRCREKETKFVLRQAMGSLLPEVVRRRTDKADFQFTFARALTTVGGELRSGALEIEKMGWVDGDRLRESYDRTIRGAPFYLGAWPLWMTLGVERWYRHVFRNRTAGGREPMEKRHG